jgi:hypothetical protein
MEDPFSIMIDQAHARKECCLALLCKDAQQGTSEAHIHGGLTAEGAMDAEPMSVSPTKNWYEVVSVVQDSVTSVPSQRNSRELVAASMSWMCLTREMCKQSSDIRWTTSLQ